jgi:hypothetical protein
VKKGSAEFARSELRFLCSSDIGNDETVLGNGKCMISDGLPIPARNACESVRDILDFDILGLRCEEIETPA